MAEKDLKFLAELVNIDSGTGDNEGISKIAAILKQEMERLDFNFQTLQGTDGSNHFYASRGQGERLLLVAHLDTVFPKGTAMKRPFRIEGERAFGPGVSDCKSGVVTILGALQELNRGQWPEYEVGCFFNSDEEIGSPGSRAILEDLAKGSQAVMVVEPAEGENLTVARKGIGRFLIQVFGKAAHSGSNYYDGKNAILELAHKVIAIQGLTDSTPGVTLNVGTISGGIRPNIIPDYAEAEIDLRLQSPEQEAFIVEELRKVAARSTIVGCTAKLTGGITRPPMPRAAGNLQLYERFKQVGTEMDIKLDCLESGGGSDANFTAVLGIPTIDGLGPVGGGHHSEEEFLDVPSLNLRIRLLTRFFQDYQRHKRIL